MCGIRVGAEEAARGGTDVLFPFTLTVKRGATKLSIIHCYHCSSQVREAGQASIVPKQNG